MRKNNLSWRLSIVAIFVPIVFGCKFFKLDEKIETIEEPKKTAITKEILRENLAAKGVKTAKSRSEKPNPLMLQLRFSNRNNDYLLNQEYFDDYGGLVNLLNRIFREREANGVFKEGTNEIYKVITLPAYQKTIDEYNSKNIYVEDFEKLVDDLRNEGFDQIELDINEDNSPTVDVPKIQEDELRIKPSDDSKKTVVGKTISGGVLNGKAIDLPKPQYPAAARAVRASGAINVQITVDENGNVVSASAVSGHPLLRSAAVAAARNAKFEPTLLSGKAVKVSGVLVFNFIP